jgi:hypothetical protein
VARFIILVSQLGNRFANNTIKKVPVCPFYNQVTYGLQSLMSESDTNGQKVDDPPTASSTAATRVIHSRMREDLER